MRAVSLKRARLNRVRKKIIAEIVGARGPVCEARELVPDVACAGPLDAHEVLTRGRGGSIVDPANIILICRFHHDFLTTHPAEAAALGLVRHSWDVA